MSTFSGCPIPDFPSRNLAKPFIRNPHFWGVIRLTTDSTMNPEKSLDRDFAVARDHGLRL